MVRVAMSVGAVVCGAGLLVAGLTGGSDRVATRDPGPSTLVLGEVIEGTTTTNAPAGSAPSAVAAPVRGGRADDTSSTSSTVLGPGGQVGATTTTARGAPTTTGRAPTTTTSTTGPCTDCGSLWTRSPGPNEPLALTVEPSARTLRHGEELVITVQAADPDAAVRAPYICVSSADGTYTARFHLGDPTGDACAVPERCIDQRSEPIDPPARSPSQGAWSVRLTPPSTGDYTITVDADSTSMACQPDPYGSIGHHASRFTVG